jgi:hexosaminidase
VRKIRNLYFFFFTQVFHWHLTDSQSFPLKLKSVPELANQGAYKLHQKRLVYTPDDVKKVIKYAYQRGVRVIPEIDMVRKKPFII